MSHDLGMKQIICMLFLLNSWVAFAETPLDYFHSYAENKEAFLKTVLQIDQKKWQTTNISWSFAPDTHLSTDIAHFRKIDSNSKPETVLVFSSGLHGIEGFIGSAVQRKLIDKYLVSSDATGSADIVMVHTLNPWGMHNKRRVDFENIDLNRNFFQDANGFQTKNADYQKINFFLNPTDQADIGVFHRISFLFKAMRLIVEYSLESLRKSILLGQGENPKGLYYKGARANLIQESITQFAMKLTVEYSHVIWIDIHTGYGENGKLHLLANDVNSKNGQRLLSLFKNHTVDFGNQQNFYKTDGDLVNYLSQLDNKITGVVFEYGTLDSQTTLGSIESLRRMVVENQAYHYGTTDDSSDREAKFLFEEMFFPKDQKWSAKIFKQTEAVLSDLGLGR